MSSAQNVIVADLLRDTMTNAGIMDDYDELLMEYDNHGSLDEYHNSVMVGLSFINRYGTQDEIMYDDFINTYLAIKGMLDEVNADRA